ncbi:hypothetical protein A3I42_01030 [Candidatus Uhrbacteria bacterium RIFCSPLOWO2_02_FULL_49_11]|uniref:Uncharacterized protein n=1 Tax=Candidatus Uhrbacteria bacterium RIFCSPLOWO2_02_FULL_49_11 TaxID=1802409 RepID=A0A1F7VCN6_9BACT|nr:MAG: hypothetical protein A3I42_01030 [Candidatus Uhrbacteria bacterium RIFCSPLOWO2_02_FULL_49_11]
MEIPIVIFLIIYSILALGFLIMSFFLVYHALRFGQTTFFNFLTLSLYVVISAFLLTSAVQFINTVDWSQTINIFSSLTSVVY